MYGFRMLSTVAALVVGVGCIIPGVVVADELVLELESVKSQYVLREPVKFCVTFKNISQSEIRIPHYDELEGEMEYIHMDVKYPDGSRGQRVIKYSHDIGIINRNYGGVPFSGGRSFSLCYYPNQSMGFGAKTFSYLWHERGPTFPVVGEYRIKFVYQAPETFKRLYRPSIESNEITISIIEPTIEEREIFDAYWAGGSISYGDYSAGNQYDRDALIGVMEKYPDNPMIKYAMFGLAVDYGCSARWQRDPGKGLDLLNEIARKYPEFRYFEVQKFRVRYLMMLNEVESARSLYKKLLKVNKDLMNIPSFIALVSWIEDGLLSPDKAIIRTWRKQMTLHGNTDELYEMLVTE